MSGLSRPAGRRERVLPWVALLLPALAWMTFEYGLASALRHSCTTVGAWLGPAWGAGSVLACILAAGLARRMARAGMEDDPPVRPWLARVAMVVSGIFALAITFQTLATLIVPSCAR